MVGHNDVFTGADEIVGEALSAFVVIDNDFINVRESVDFLLRFFVERVAAVSDGMLVNNRDGEVDIVPEAVGMISERIDMLSTIIIELRFGMNLDELEAKSFGGELLRFWVGAVAATTNEILAAAERIALARIEIIARNFDALNALFF